MEEFVEESVRHGRGICGGICGGIVEESNEGSDDEGAVEGSVEGRICYWKMREKIMIAIKILVTMFIWRWR